MGEPKTKYHRKDHGRGCDPVPQAALHHGELLDEFWVVVSIAGFGIIDEEPNHVEKAGKPTCKSDDVKSFDDTVGHKCLLYVLAWTIKRAFSKPEYT